MKWDNVAIRIKSKRKELGLTLAALGTLIGKNRQDGKSVSHVTIRNWEAGAEIKKDNFDALAKALRVTTAWLEYGDSLSVRETQATYNAQIMESNDVPLISMVAAGNWTECVDPYPMGFGEQPIPCPVKHSNNSFAVKISGESMMPRFMSGDIIFCDPNQRPENGDFIIAKLTDDNQATFKQLIIEDGNYFLKAINPNWPQQFVPINGNCHIVGRVIAKLDVL